MVFLVFHRILSNTPAHTFTNHTINPESVKGGVSCYYCNAAFFPVMTQHARRRRHRPRTTPDLRMKGMLLLSTGQIVFKESNQWSEAACILESLNMFYIRSNQCSLISHRVALICCAVRLLAEHDHKCSRQS